ncbi:MAG TPA: glycosyltransferase family 4 protein [Pyrinomonadaceae bacterium]
MILTLQTNAFGPYGGIATYNRLVCRVLNDFGPGVEKRVLLMTDTPAGIRQPGADLPSLSLEAFAGHRRAFVQRVAGLALKARIDLALIGHVNYAPLGLLLKRLQPQLRYGIIIYGIEAWERQSRIHRRAMRKADFVISISEYTKRRALEVNGPFDGRAYLLPNALEWTSESAAPDMPLARVPAGTHLLSVCRLDSNEKYKGVDQVIEALPEIAARVPDVQYIVVGGGTDLERHRELAIKTGVAERVHFLGFVDDATLRSCYRNCDLFVMPSAGEGFGFVYLEAMQYGKAVVAANSGGAPEVVLDGLTGALVQYGDREQLARVLIELCLDPSKRRELGQAGYQRLQAQFTFPRFKQILTETLLRELPAASVYKSRRRALTEMAH